jgi:flagellar basal body-associated protein FliL
MLKGSALYIVIIISLVIALICSALVLAAYFFQGTVPGKIPVRPLAG